ncbi:MAG TPA: carboxymuconolactone decarboxylase family protein [Gemmatimonadaceae bacterium]
MNALDGATAALVRLSAVITVGTDVDIRNALANLAPFVPPVWVEELLLQSYLFAGFPRALNAMRSWRQLNPAPVSSEHSRDIAEWAASGQVTCSAVYGSMYERLRENIRTLHPALDDWMVTEGYGKVLSRPGLDLPRRELCIVAACAAAGQDRQLLSHLHGARNVGVSRSVMDDAVQSIASILDGSRAQSLRLLWARVRGP